MCQPIQVETVQAANSPLPSDAHWLPTVGPALLATLANKQNLVLAEREAVVRQTVSILGKCMPPSAPASNITGLALGYVQSGKTLSFTCVTALASDTHFPLVIVITGISEPLFDQSVDRLRGDLGIDNPNIHDRRWQFFENPRIQHNHHDRIAAVLAEWQDPQIADRQTCVIAVMKNHRHLGHLLQLLQQLSLAGIPAIVIDDEADQASLNTQVKRDVESRTYQFLLALRRALPRHTYIQYTATPQAPLLINTIDILSPRFVEILEPGHAYVGLADFFHATPGLVITIPDIEIPSHTTTVQGAPESLRHALLLFFVGAAAGTIERASGRRSMLVHPSRLQEGHANYFHWVSAVRTDWLRLLASQDEPDRPGLLAEFAAAHAELLQTFPSIPPFPQIEAVLRQTINRAQLWEVNTRRAGKTTQVDWNAGYAHILVGGQALDRGFTVEGLTVTYMPRGRGVGNADTIQQRARFLGYKRNILGLCRVFLEGQVQEAYTAYARHEENLHRLLRQHSATGRPLSEWRRAFFLDSSLQPTRRCVLNLDYDNRSFAAEWFYPRTPQYTEESVTNNRTLVQLLRENLQFIPTNGHVERTAVMRHAHAAVRLADLYRVASASVHSGWVL